MNTDLTNRGNPVKWDTAGRVIVFLLVSLVITGCFNDPGTGTDTPPELEDYYFWDEIYLVDSKVQIYGSEASPVTKYIDLKLYFPEGLPEQPQGSFLYVSLRHNVEGEILTAPCSPYGRYIASSGIFDAFIAPQDSGSWTLELHWVGEAQDGRAYVNLDIEPITPSYLVLETGQEFDNYVVAWKSDPPEMDTVNTTPFRLQVWYSEHAMQGYEETNETLQLTFQVFDDSDSEEKDQPYPRMQHVGDGLYIGSLFIDEYSLWEIRVNLNDLNSQEIEHPTVSFYFQLNQNNVAFD